MIDNTHRLDTEDKFATDATFLPELRAQKDRTLALIQTRQAAFTARTGTPMAPGVRRRSGLR